MEHFHEERVVGDGAGRVQEFLGGQADESQFVEQYKQLSELVVHVGVLGRTVLHQRAVHLRLYALHQRLVVEARHVCNTFTPVLTSKFIRDLLIVFLRSNGISNRIARPIRFRIEFLNRIGRIYHASRNTV